MKSKIFIFIILFMLSFPLAAYSVGEKSIDPFIIIDLETLERDTVTWRDFYPTYYDICAPKYEITLNEKDRTLSIDLYNRYGVISRDPSGEPDRWFWRQINGYYLRNPHHPSIPFFGIKSDYFYEYLDCEIISSEYVDIHDFKLCSATYWSDVENMAPGLKPIIPYSGFYPESLIIDLMVHVQSDLLGIVAAQYEYETDILRVYKHLTIKVYLEGSNHIHDIENIQPKQVRY